MSSVVRGAGCAILALAISAAGVGSLALAQDGPAAVLELRFTPAPRAQIAIWIEDANGRFVRTFGLTQAVAYRGIGNRPGASLMNSGYRWPYGRREGVLPVWAARRAAAPGARKWRRVIFQNRTSEGLASRTSSDQSPDDYFCLSFNRATTTREALDAVSCASVFTSDKGRFLTAEDVQAGYAEPWEDPGTTQGRMVPLPAESPYPPRMDVSPCVSGCFDHADLADFADHARSVMPEIDEVTMATPPGMVEQSLLFSVPPQWPAGTYSIWIEVGVEGDYNGTFSAGTFPTPTLPANKWDTWAETYGYPYRGQPSVVYRVDFEHAEPGEASYASAEPVGRSSWQFWNEGYGELEPLSGMSDDPDGASGSGIDRLLLGDDGERVKLHVQTLLTPPPATEGMPDPFVPPDPPEQPPDGGPTGSGGAGGSAGGSEASAGEGGASGSSGGGADEPDEPQKATDGPATSPEDRVPRADEHDEAVILVESADDDAVGDIRELRLRPHSNRLHAHEWVALSFLAARSDVPLHDYEVRVGTEPISDAASFLRNGRPAKTATTDAEGSVALMLDPTVKAGSTIRAEIGDLAAATHYYVAVRATDRLNRHGPISVAQITTKTREFATVTPCFIASAAYGSPLAHEVGALRRLRDRFLLSHAPGRALVAAYYAHGPELAASVREQPWLRSLVQSGLRAMLALARALGDG